MMRFVILRHEMPADSARVSHWDLMLQDGPRLRTWAMAELPGEARPFTKLDALPDHRLEYLDHEGPVSGGRGRVTCWDRGLLNWVVNETDRCIAHVHGKRIQAELRLTLDPGGQRWLLAAVPLEAADRG